MRRCVMLPQGGVWPQDLQVSFLRSSVELSWLYPFDDGGASVKALSGQGRISRGGLNMQQRASGRVVMCGTVQVAAHVLPVEGESALHCLTPAYS